MFVMNVSYEDQMMKMVKGLMYGPEEQPLEMPVMNFEKPVENESAEQSRKPNYDGPLVMPEMDFGDRRPR